MRKIALLLLAGFIGISSIAYAQEVKKSTHHFLTNGLSIGYNKGIEACTKGTPSFATTNRIVLRKFIAKNWSVETGIKFGNVANTYNTVKGDRINGTAIAIPATVQYNFKTGHSKVHPYCGAGMMYNVNARQQPGANDEVKILPPVQMQDGPNLLLTQGTTIEINTHLQFNEAIHFIPQTNNNIIGIDIGIGFRL